MFKYKISFDLKTNKGLIFGFEYNNGSMFSGTKVILLHFGMLVCWIMIDRE